MQKEELEMTNMEQLRCNYFWVPYMIQTCEAGVENVPLMWNKECNDI